MKVAGAIHHKCHIEDFNAFRNFGNDPIVVAEQSWRMGPYSKGLPTVGGIPGSDKWAIHAATANELEEALGGAALGFNPGETAAIIHAQYELLNLERHEESSEKYITMLLKDKDTGAVVEKKITQTDKGSLQDCVSVEKLHD